MLWKLAERIFYQLRIIFMAQYYFGDQHAGKLGPQNPKPHLGK